MRHAFGFLLGILLTPALAYGMAWGFARSRASVNAMDLTVTDETQFYGAYAAMGAVGLVIGILVVARWISPCVSMIPALGLLGWSGWYLAEPARAAGLAADLPPSGELDTALQMLLSTGLLALVGFILFVTAWAPYRWPHPHDGLEDDYDYRPPPRTRR
ncbi:hypothetical protein [Actinocorallia populi]|uniref:hypothetical protein n=1 Tax=Actinocorallia populi TaxID=2079200 RepID=UPI0018E56DB8|nr:hypothetical protein [Actinocorallia populi]